MRWSDVDLEVGKITINATRVVVDHAVLQSEPKTPKSFRAIAIAPSVVESLRTLRRA